MDRHGTCHKRTPKGINPQPVAEVGNKFGVLRFNVFQNTRTGVARRLSEVWQHERSPYAWSGNEELKGTGYEKPAQSGRDRNNSQANNGGSLAEMWRK
jgi:hypothetical protein